MTADEQQALDNLQQQYDTMDDQLDQILDPASPFTNEQRAAYANAVNIALNNYLAASTSILGRDSASIKHVNAIVQAAQTSIATSLGKLADIANNINLITNAVNTVGTALSILKT